MWSFALVVTDVDGVGLVFMVRVAMWVMVVVVVMMVVLLLVVMVVEREGTTTPRADLEKEGIINLFIVPVLL